MRWILMACLAMGWGCDDGDGGGDGGAGAGGGGNDGPAENCQARCEAKLTTCGQGALASAGCSSIVCGDATESELTCLEGSACDDISAAISSNMPICGIGESDGTCPQLSGCACGVSGVVMIGGECAMTCEEACAAFGA